MMRYSNGHASATSRCHGHHNDNFSIKCHAAVADRAEDLPLLRRPHAAHGGRFKAAPGHSQARLDGRVFATEYTCHGLTSYRPHHWKGERKMQATNYAFRVYLYGA